MAKLRVKRKNTDYSLPIRTYPYYEIGTGLYADEDKVIWPFKVAKVKTGVFVYLDRSAESDTENKKYGFVAKGRSGMVAKGFSIVGGVVDADRTGEVIVLLRTTGLLPRRIKKGQKIAQMLPL